MFCRESECSIQVGITKFWTPKLVRVPAGDVIGDAGCAAIFEGSVSRAGVPWGIELPEVDHSRLDCLRRSLSSRGFSEETVNTAFKKWEQSTNDSYDHLWQAWTTFARLYGSGTLDPSEPLLSAYLTHLAKDKKQAEATISKVKTVIQSHWSFSQGVGVSDALSKAAGKLNRPKGQKYKEIWDLSYVFELIAKPPSPTTAADRIEELYRVRARMKSIATLQLCIFNSSIFLHFVGVSAMVIWGCTELAAMCVKRHTYETLNCE